MLLQYKYEKNQYCNPYIGNRLQNILHLEFHFRTNAPNELKSIEEKKSFSVFKSNKWSIILGGTCHLCRPFRFRSFLA